MDNEDVGSITVMAGTGLTPTYTWTGGDLFSVTVARTSAPAVPVWGVAATPAADNLASGVTHGTVPGGAIQTFSTETTLTAGIQYTVSVSRTDPVAVGFTDFTAN